MAEMSREVCGVRWGLEAARPLDVGVSAQVVKRTRLSARTSRQAVSSALSARAGSRGGTYGGEVAERGRGAAGDFAARACDARANGGMCCFKPSCGQASCPY